MIWKWFSKYKPPRLESPGTLFTPSADSNEKPRIIISLDRSWHNLLGLTRLAFYNLIRRAGGVPRWVDYGTGPEPEDLAPIAESIIASGDGLLLSGGMDVDPALYGAAVSNRSINPRRDRFEMALVAEARAKGLPILGICRGTQLLNVVYGGTLQTIKKHPELNAVHNSLRHHPVQIQPDSRIAHSTGKQKLSVVSIHGQAVCKIGDKLNIVGQTNDGIVEAIEEVSTKNWIVGVQWHPEYMIYSRPEHKIIQSFVRQAAHRKSA